MSRKPIFETTSRDARRRRRPRRWSERPWVNKLRDRSQESEQNALKTSTHLPVALKPSTESDARHLARGVSSMPVAFDWLRQSIATMRVYVGTALM